VQSSCKREDQEAIVSQREQAFYTYSFAGKRAGVSAVEGIPARQPFRAEPVQCLGAPNLLQQALAVRDQRLLVGKADETIGLY
jgi:hypothetical protein